MQIVWQFARILLICLAGEILHGLLPLPIPAGIYGLLLLLLLLCLGAVKTEDIGTAGRFLLGIFPLLFIPGAVGILQYKDVLLRILPVLVLVTLPVTALVFAVSGLVTQRLMRRRGHE